MYMFSVSITLKDTSSCMFNLSMKECKRLFISDVKTAVIKIQLLFNSIIVQIQVNICDTFATNATYILSMILWLKTYTVDKKDQNLKVYDIL